MNKIEIIHNPFTVDTQFYINGQAPAQGCKLSSYKESRLQLWVEKLFDELRLLFNGDERYHISFTGVESDYLDITEAAQAACSRGAQIHVDWKEVDSSEARLERIRALRNEAMEHPDFHRFISENEHTKDSFDEAFNRDFDVYVVATMSSGKSTLINAMLGRDLLPAANEATTARIARITDNESLGDRFTARRLDERGRVLDSSDNADPKSIAVWNREPDTHFIDIEGNIQGVDERDSVRLVLTDTPGPNNSQDKDHQLTTMSFIQDSRRNPLILYVLNATQLGTNDDKHLLGLVAEIMEKGGKQSKDRFIFVINKMDQFDPENEDIPAVLGSVTRYLTENGIPNPLIYPISANFARLLRKPHTDHTRKELSDYNGMVELFREEPAMNLLQYMPITSRVSRNLSEKKLPELLLSSGLPAVEAMIDEYIEKYNFPHRVKRAYDAMLHAIEIGMDEAQLIEQLDTEERSLGRIDEEIEALRGRQEQGFKSGEFRDKMKLEGLGLPKEVIKNLTKLEAMPEKCLRQLEESFRGESSVRAAEAKVSDAEKRVRMEFNKLINEYEALFESCQDLIREELSKKYQYYVADLFKESRELKLPVFDGLQKKMGNISLDLTIKSREIDTRRVVIGSREESDSKWYNPFSWGKKKSVNTYGDEEYVNLMNLWGERVTLIDAQFTKLVNNARGEIESMKDKLTDRFIEFMTEEFESRFNEILDDLKEKFAERKTLEEAIREARELQSWIGGFKAKLNQTLAV